MKNICTIYGETLDRQHPLKEHPNPYFERRDYLSLNGPWLFSKDKSRDFPKKYEREIIVPFSVETPLSGINEKVEKDDFLHYKKVVSIPAEKRNCLVRLVFTAVDQEAKVFVDGVLSLENKFGYIPFECVFPLAGREEVTIEVLAHDDIESPLHARGKQSTHPKGIWYHPTSGIWGSVYLEFLPDGNYLSSLTIDPDYDRKKLRLKVSRHGEILPCSVDVLFKGEKMGSFSLGEALEGEIDLSISFHPWSAEEPNVYDLVFHNGQDEVLSHFCFRKIEKVVQNGIPFLLINGKPTFLSALLDQGYYPESGLTAPSYDALKEDILFAKKAGFNALRKHIKIEPLRWYYLCDTLGMYVIQDFVNGGAPYSFLSVSIPGIFPKYQKNDASSKGLGRKEKESRDFFEEELERTFSHLRNVPSIVVWTLFNEGWGQFEAVRLTEKLRSLDSSRLIDSTSGWYDKGVGDFLSRHIYFSSILRMHSEEKRILSLSEFGGYGLKVPGHTYCEKAFGYKNFKTKEELENALKKLYGEVLEGIRKLGLGMSVYTELTDVEEELNGLLTYDRKVEKVDRGLLKELNSVLYLEYSKIFKGKC